ncbi:MAG: acetyl-CoA carboxylase carboxyl transferase subunit beta, partial [Armatimonadetes bacterium]|nr:acetyl-CoA carboxylase carboxyl transferase subunit beta [Armatimonadota bacterium]
GSPATPGPDIPEGLWTQCPKCKEVLFGREWERRLKVCLKCNHHFWLSAPERIELLVDPGTFVERDGDLRSANPLDFPGYAEKLKRHGQNTGLSDAIVSGEAELGGFPLTLAVTDAHFMRGAMGSVVGERLARTVERATERRIPTLLVSGSGGGARMEEGLLSLMQMAKTSAALARHHDARALSIVFLTDPSLAGIMASWGSLGDILIAEPAAQIGFVRTGEPGQGAARLPVRRVSTAPRPD